MRIVPLQSFGIGDVIFTQTLVREIADGNPILWGTEPQFIDGLNLAYPDITFVDKRRIPVDYNRRDDYIINDMRVLPIRWADAILRVDYSQCMRAKYDLYGKDWSTWMQRAQWHRDRAKEEQLYQTLGLQPNQPYVLINSTFGSDCCLNVDIKNQTGIRAVQMKVIPGYSLFDWAAVIQRATEIQTVSTSIIYLLELLELTAKKVHLYTRKPIEPHFRNIDYILKRHQYVFHD